MHPENNRNFICNNHNNPCGLGIVFSPVFLEKKNMKKIISQHLFES